MWGVGARKGTSCPSDGQERGVGSGMLSGAVRNGESGRGESSGGGEEGGKNGITLLYYTSKREKVSERDQQTIRGHGTGDETIRL